VRLRQSKLKLSSIHDKYKRVRSEYKLYVGKAATLFGTATKIKAYSGITLQRAKEVQIKYKSRRATAMTVFNHAKHIKDNLSQRAAFYKAKQMMKMAAKYRDRAKGLFKRANGQLTLSRRILGRARKAGRRVQDLSANLSRAFARRKLRQYRMEVMLHGHTKAKTLKKTLRKMKRVSSKMGLKALSKKEAHIKAKMATL